MNTRILLGPLGVSIICIVASAIGVLIMAPPLLAAFFRPGAADTGLETKIDTLVTNHAEEAALYRDRFENRSPFFLPIPPPPEPVRQEPTHVETPVQRDQPAPRNYGGPLRPDGSIGESVLFLRGSEVIWLQPGESSNGVRLVSVNPPWSITVAWTAPSTPTARYPEGTYELPMLRRGDEMLEDALLSEPPAPGSRRTPGLEVQDTTAPPDQAGENAADEEGDVQVEDLSDDEADAEDTEAEEEQHDDTEEEDPGD